MSLNYQYYGKEDTKQWSKTDWELYNQMIWQSMVIDMGKLTEENIYEWVRRCNLMPMYIKVTKCKCGDETRQERKYDVDEIRKFIGLSTNVITLAPNKWATKRFGKIAAELRIAEMKRYENKEK